MFQISNFNAIEARGGFLCGNDNFHIVQCVDCGCQYLYEDELTRIFHDPTDLAIVTHDFVGEPSRACRSCSKENFSVEELGGGKEQKVREGPWCWLLQ